MAEVENWKDIKRKIQWKQFKAKLNQGLVDGKELAKNSWDWVKENKEMLMFVSGGIVGTTKICGKIKNVVDEAKAEKQIWDPSIQQHVKLKHKLRDFEKKEINERFSRGEKLHDIYRSMDILK